MEATNDRNWNKFEVLVAENFTRHSSSGNLRINSRQKLKAFHVQELETFPDIRETIIMLLGEGELVAARINFKGTQLGPMGPFPPSGRVLDADFNCIFRVVEGRLQESWVEYDNLEGLLQLGHYKLPQE